jgi:hypothetical protein
MTKKCASEVRAKRAEKSGRFNGKTKVCTECQKEQPMEAFVGANGHANLRKCIDCRLKERPIYALAMRRCHECGRLTTDYRCPVCLDAWRKKHGVRLTALSEPEGPGGCAEAGIALKGDAMRERGSFL